MIFKSTKKHSKYWEQRKIDWNQHYQQTWNHPHRGLISWILSTVDWVSLWEVGVGGGANLIRIIKDLPGRQMGGSDVNADAIAACTKALPGGLFQVESGDNMLLSDRSVDIILSDMTLIYVSPIDIRKYIREFKRVARVAIVLCEFHHTSFWKRWLARLTGCGYHVYNYQKLLESEGFYDVHCQKIPIKYWPGTDKNTEFRHIITAKIP